MARLSDTMLADRMLQARKRGGYRILPFVRMNAKGYSFLVIYFGAALAFLAFNDLWFPFCAVLGLIFGVFLRDVCWLIGVQRTWPFVTKVTDWDKVQKIYSRPGATLRDTLLPKLLSGELAIRVNE